jgi:type IV secretion system protein VirB1
MWDCPDLAVPAHIMRHVVHVESAGRPFAIGVVGARLSRQPRDLDEALAAVRLLKARGYDFSVGLAQVNRYNLAHHGIRSYEEAFDVCTNLRVGAQILRGCYERARDWGKALSCYYAGNFVTGFEQGYVRKVLDAMARSPGDDITVIARDRQGPRPPARDDGVALTRAEAGVAPHAATASVSPAPNALRPRTASRPPRARPRGPATVRGGVLVVPANDATRGPGTVAGEAASDDPPATDRAFVF